MHGNIKYKFNEMVNVGDKLNTKPNNIYSLKAAFRQYNEKRKDAKEPLLVCVFNECGGKRVEVELTGFKTIS